MPVHGRPSSQREAGAPHDSTPGHPSKGAAKLSPVNRMLPRLAKVVGGCAGAAPTRNAFSNVCCCLLPHPCPQVKAVVLRINSPGGSAVASDMIAREVQLLREAGKPVVACMGDVAASGGYYIAGALVLLCWCAARMSCACPRSSWCLPKQSLPVNLSSAGVCAVASHHRHEGWPGALCLSSQVVAWTHRRAVQPRLCSPPPLLPCP